MEVVTDAVVEVGNESLVEVVKGNTVGLAVLVAFDWATLEQTDAGEVDEIEDGHKAFVACDVVVANVAAAVAVVVVDADDAAVGAVVVGASAVASYDAATFADVD